MVETVVFPTLSGSAQGQFAAAAGRGPGLLLLPDVNGLASWLLARAERLAGSGVWTLVLDLLGGQGTWSDGVEDNASRFLAWDLAEGRRRHQRRRAVPARPAAGHRGHGGRVG
jgi:dienelactone hydrolase